MSKVLFLDYKINPLMTSVMSGRDMYVYELTYNHYQKREKRALGNF